MSVELKEFERIVLMDKIIASGCCPSATDLMERCGSSRATFFRDLERLQRVYKAPLSYNKIRGGYEYTEKTFRIPYLLSSEGQIKAAKLMVNLLETIKGTPLYEEAQEVFQTLATIVPEPVNPLHSKKEENFINDSSNRRIFLGAPISHLSTELWDLLNQALDKNRLLSFDYQPSDVPEEKHKTVQPWQLIFDNGNWNLWAYDYEYKKPLLFTLSEMKNPLIRKESFELPHDYDFRNHTTGSFGCFTSDWYGSYCIRLSGYIASRAPHRIWGANQKVEAEVDATSGEPTGSILLKFDSNQYAPILTWVLGWGADAEPLEPPEFVKLWKEKVHSAYQKAFPHQ